MEKHAKRTIGEGNSKMKLSDNLKEWIKDILSAVICAAIVLVFIMPTIVNQTSMENTLIPKDYVLVSRQHYKLFGKDFENGDIIVFQSDIDYEGGKKLLVKRIIAVGGDTISISDGKVFVNGEELIEDYIKDGYTNGTVEEIRVPEGYLYCMGDNRLVSLDSRDSSVGLVKEDTVKGKVFLRLFPLKSFGKVE